MIADKLNLLRLELDDLKDRIQINRTGNIGDLDYRLEKLCDLFESLLTVIEEVPAELRKFDKRVAELEQRIDHPDWRERR